jgi:hypothetical protein
MKDNLISRLSQLSKVSINSVRVRLGGMSKAKEVLTKEGFTTSNGINYTRIEKAEVEDKLSYKIESNRAVIVTSYLIGSNVNKLIWDSITSHAAQIEAEIVVIAHRYQNPTNLQQSLREEEGCDYIDPLVIPYLCWEDFTIHNHNIAASIQVNCTTLNPLTSAKRFCFGHTVIGHSIQALDVIATTKLKPASVLWASGTISDIESASNMKAKAAQAHYKFGWIVVEPDGSSRNVHCCGDGTFADVGCYEDDTVEAIVWGDFHNGQTCADAYTWAMDYAVQLQPKYLILHDFFDGATVNPHASPYERSLLFDGSLEKEVDYGVNELIAISEELSNTKIGLVVSNHNDMMTRYFNSNKLSDLSRGDRSVLTKWLLAGASPEELLISMAGDRVFKLDQHSKAIGGLSLNHHGDVGANGSKCSLQQLFNLSFRGVVGHSHTPGMLGGAHQVGTLSKLDLGYNSKGLSDWKQSFAIVSTAGKVQHIIKF